MYKLLLVTSLTLFSVGSYADTVSSYLKDLCFGKDVTDNNAEADKAEKIFSYLHGSERYACKVRDDGYVEFLIKKYSSNGIRLDSDTKKSPPTERSAPRRPEQDTGRLTPVS